FFPQMLDAALMANLLLPLFAPPVMKIRFCLGEAIYFLSEPSISFLNILFKVSFAQNFPHIVQLCSSPLPLFDFSAIALSASSERENCLSQFMSRLAFAMSLSGSIS